MFRRSYLPDRDYPAERPAQLKLRERLCKFDDAVFGDYPAERPAQLKRSVFLASHTML